MTEINKPIKSLYKKRYSFDSTYSKLNISPDHQHERTIAILADAIRSEPDPKTKELLSAAREALLSEDSTHSLPITQLLADELSLLSDHQLPEFFAHRYRYELYPVKQVRDEYPPCLQIEPSSICNYRCVFCYQTDNTFSSRSSGMMGRMSFETFKRAVDLAAGQVHFVSLASRGEPLLCKELPKMLEYAGNKFLSLKVNTNASMLTEETAHALLKNGVRTVVFSADAAKEPLYGKLRVGGVLEKVKANISMFEKIRRDHYSSAKVVTRVSGVRLNNDQDMNDMVDFWGDFVDQITFVTYNPWENIYDAKPNGTKTACSDLWRRLFIWWDGSINPCDSDFKSTLKLGNIMETTLTDIWKHPRFELLREAHASGNRTLVEPCKRCAVT